MIEITDLSLRINRKTILKDINLVIPDNTMTAVLGKSGCGKTMLMKCIIGLHKPTSGTIRIDGDEALSGHYAKRSMVYDKIAMLFQNAALLDSFTVYQNVSIPLFERREKTAQEIRSLVQEVLEFVGLQHTSELFPSELSGGMRKRIGLARALITQPRYLILDEPTTGLDPITADEVLSFLKLVVKEKQIIPLTITHDPFCIQAMGEFIVIMDNGQILFAGNKDDLTNHKDTSLHEFYTSFFPEYNKASLNFS